MKSNLDHVHKLFCFRKSRSQSSFYIKHFVPQKVVCASLEKSRTSIVVRTSAINTQMYRSRTLFNSSSCLNSERERIQQKIILLHCNYLDIYISRKIRLCVVDFEGKFQANLQAKLFISLVWKFKSIIIIFLLFIAEFVKYSAFYTLMLLFQRVDIFELQFLPDVS